MTENFIEEIKEEVRRDQLIGLWTRYGNWLMSIFIGVLSFVTVYLFWHNYQQNKLHSQTLAYERSMQQISSGLQGDFASIVKDASNGYKLLSIFGESTRNKKNLGLLRDVSSNVSFDSFYRDLAIIKMVMSSISSHNSVALLEQLGKISENSFLYSYVLELKALVHLKYNNKAMSRDILLRILSSKNFSKNSKLRAKALIDTI